MEFLIILKCSVSFLLITLQEEFPAIFIHFVKFAAEQVLKSFLAEIIPYSPLVLDFLLVFNMV